MSEGVITTTEEIEELKKKLALLGKTWLIRISLVYKLHKCQRFLELAYWTLRFKHFSTSDFKLIECFSLGFLPLLFIVQRATVCFTPAQCRSCLHFCADGDRKAYYESSQWTMKKNKDTISKLREKNKRLRFELAKKKAVCGFEIVN